VFEWLTWAASELALVTDEKLAHLNSHLATRTFLAGNCASLADLVVFGTIHPAVVSGHFPLGPEVVALRHMQARQAICYKVLLWVAAGQFPREGTSRAFLYTD
jgi:glutathione S-transferase